MSYSDRLSISGRRMEPSPIRRLAHLANKPGVISLAGGMPSTETFPLPIIKELLVQAFERRGAAAFQYGMTRGNRELVEWLVGYMERRGIATIAEDMLLTSGSQQAIRLLAEVLLDPGDVAIVELPSYTGGLAALRNSGADLVGVQQDDDGIVARDLAATLERLRHAGRRVKLIYTIPNFQNPSGVTLSLENRRELLRLARRYDLLVIEDDPYYELYFDRAGLLPPLKALDEDRRVIYLSSFSKILVPGLRTAWMCAPPEIARAVELAKEAADLCSSTLDQEVVLGYCRDGHLDRHVPRIRAFYYERREAMLSALSECMPPGVTWTRPQGGFFIWVRLPTGMDAAAFFEESIARGVAYVIGAPFHVDGGGQNTMRLAYSKENPEVLRRGVKILSELLVGRVASAREAVIS